MLFYSRAASFLSVNDTNVHLTIQPCIKLMFTFTLLSVRCSRLHRKL